MSFAPPRKPSDREKLYWSLADRFSFGGKVFDTIEELQGRLEDRVLEEGVQHQGSGDEIYNAGYVVIGEMKSRSFIPLAYRCGACKKVVPGAPLLVDEESITSLHPLSGREGYDMYCTSCNAHLRDVTLARS